MRKSRYNMTGGRAGRSAPRWVYRKFIQRSISRKELADAFTRTEFDSNWHSVSPARPVHQKSKNCRLNFCGACYEKAKGR